MTVAAAEAALREFELATDIFQFRVDGWCAWPLLRLSAGYTVHGLRYVSGATFPRSRRLAVVGADLARLPRIGRRDYLLKTYVSGLADERDGRFIDIWFGDLAPRLGGVLQIDGINNPGYLERRARALHPGDLTSAFFDAAAAVAARIQTPPEVRRVAREMSRLLGEHFGAEALPGATVERILNRFHALLRIHRRLLDRVQPKAVLLADFGEYALAAAARERAIPVLELQHGVIYPDHHGYGYTAAARPHRNAMPVANRLLLYGEHWKCELAENTFWDGCLDVVGSVRMDEHRSRGVTRGRAGRRVLLTTQGIDTDRAIDFIAEYLRIERSPDVRVTVKLHPAYEPNKDEFAHSFPKDDRAELLLGHEGPSTFDLLRKSDVHVSISSTCHYEALGLGARTAVLPFTSHEIVDHLWHSGHATLLSSPQDLHELVRQDRTVDELASIGDYYFQPGALENMMSVIARESSSPRSSPDRAGVSQ